MYSAMRLYLLTPEEEFFLFVESASILSLLFSCVSSHRWVHFPRSVLFHQGSCKSRVLRLWLTSLPVWRGRGKWSWQNRGVPVRRRSAQRDIQSSLKGGTLDTSRVAAKMTVSASPLFHLMHKRKTYASQTQSKTMIETKSIWEVPKRCLGEQ